MIDTPCPHAHLRRQTLDSPFARFSSSPLSAAKPDGKWTARFASYCQHGSIKAPGLLGTSSGWRCGLDDIPVLATWPGTRDGTNCCRPVKRSDGQVRHTGVPRSPPPSRTKKSQLSKQRKAQKLKAVRSLAEKGYQAGEKTWLQRASKCPGELTNMSR